MKLITCILMCALSCADAIDFTPHEVKEIGEGGEYTYLRFANGDQAVTYMPPKYWDYRGDENEFRLTAPNVVGTEVEISKESMEEPLVAAQENLNAFEALATESLPQGASKIKTVASSFTPCEIDGYKTVEVTLSYVLFGQSLVLSRLYLPRTKDMLCFKVVSKASDFEAVRRTFQASLHSLAGL